MHMREYVMGWLTGVGRSDLARKADRDELPELLTQESRDMFTKFQRSEASPNDFLWEVFGIGEPTSGKQDEEATKPLGR
jgi:hypothetical protein